MLLLPRDGEPTVWSVKGPWTFVSLACNLNLMITLAAANSCGTVRWAARHISWAVSWQNWTVRYIGRSLSSVRNYVIIKRRPFTGFLSTFYMYIDISTLPLKIKSCLLHGRFHLWDTSFILSTVFVVVCTEYVTHGCFAWLPRKSIRVSDGDWRGDFNTYTLSLFDTV
jgi:hypothetical protein